MNHRVQFDFHISNSKIRLDLRKCQILDSFQERNRYFRDSGYSW